MAVNCRDGRPGILEDAQIRLAVRPIPLTDGVMASTAENAEAVLKVDPGREHIASAGQNDRQVAELTFEPIEGTV
jgi:hypothetical protein